MEAIEPDAPPTKRFKHQSYAASLKEVHAPSALSQSHLGEDLTDNQSYFHEALDHWRQLNLTPAFIKFANQTSGISSTIAQLLHHWKDVLNHWEAAMNVADDEAMKALLDLLQKLAHDLRTTLSPAYLSILGRLFALLQRPLSATTVTALLATFSALFKYLLVPSVDSTLPVQTWANFRETSQKCNSEVQRAFAEVWGSVVRRLKPNSRDLVMTEMVQNLEGVEDAAAWTFVSACTSVSQTLHTATAGVLAQLLTLHAGHKDGDGTFMLTRRVMTALIHHCKGAEQFSAVGDLLVGRLSSLTETSSLEPVETPLARIIDVVSVAASVRQGSRLTKPQVADILACIPKIAYSSDLHIPLVRLSTSALIAADLSLWTSHGRKVIERSQLYPTFFLALLGSLAELNWGGWKLLGLPAVLRRTPDLLETEPDTTLQLLAGLYNGRKLEPVDHVWKTRVGHWVEARLKSWSISDQQVCNLPAIITIVPIIPSQASLLAQIVESTLEIADPRSDFEASPTSSTLVLTSCLHGLAKDTALSWVNNVNMTSWIRIIVERWSWSEGALTALVDLVAVHGSNLTPIPFHELYPHLRAAILSHSRNLRLGALNLLATRAVGPWSGAEVVKRCLQGEEVSLDVQGVRERVLRVGRLEQVIQEDDEKAAEVAARWLIAQLKVNLRPLWMPAAEALARLSDRFGDVVWPLLFGELQSAAEGYLSDAKPTWMDEMQDDQTSDGIFEDEFTWRDPGAHKLLVATGHWCRKDDLSRKLTQEQISTDRFDKVTYEAQLLSALGVSHSLAEKHNRELVPFFLKLMDAQLARQKLTNWLSLLSKFVNPKALYSTDKLYAHYILLLSHADRSLQTIALSCILNYKSPHLVRHEDSLRALLDDTRWRDELANLDTNGIDAQDRDELIDVIVRLLFGVMLERRGRGRGADRRAAVLTTLGGCSDEELGLLVELMLRPLQIDGILSVERYADNPPVFTVPEQVTEKQRAGFLNLLGDVLRNLGPRLMKLWPALVSATVTLTADAQRRLNALKNDVPDDEGEEDEEDEEEGEVSATRATRTVRQHGVKRFTDFFRIPVTFEFGPYVEHAYSTFISPRLAVLDQENTQSPSALLELFYVWACRTEYSTYLVSHDQRVLPKVYDCLIATNVKPSVIGRIFDLVDKVLDQSETDERIADEVVKPHVGRLLSNISVFIQRSKEMANGTHPLFYRLIAILSRVAQYLADPAQASTLLSLLTPLLRKSHKVVNDKLKTDTLKVLRSIFPIVAELNDAASALYVKTYETLSQLFQNLRSRAGRVELLSSFRQLADLNPARLRVVEVVEELNAYSAKRIEQPDFDRRLKAFAVVNETLTSQLSPQEWLPLLYNMLFFVQDAEELAIRTNASTGLKRFIGIVSANPGSEYEKIFLRVVFPALKNGLRTKSEIVRAEVLSVVAHGIRACEGVSALREMRGLLADGDEEANFFNNILHVQMHRRTRALRRLAEYSEQGHLHSVTIAEVFIPLVGNFITGTQSLDHHLVNEAVTTTGRLSKQLSWGAYHALVQQYLRLSKDKEKSEKAHVRTLVAVLDAFHFPMDDVAVEMQDVQGDTDDLPPAVRNPSTSGKIADAVNQRLLPALLNHLEDRKEAEEGARIPIATGIVKIALHLPRDRQDLQITKLVTAVSQILRSKSQETRDLVRETLCRIATMLGASYLAVIMRELRGALTRGPQLHVLAFTAHALLVHVTSKEHSKAFPDLDDSLSDIVHVSSEAIFGESGKAVQSDEFKTKMKEVRTAAGKGLDSFQILATHITAAKISSLLLPVRAILQETISHKVLQVVDDVLRRISSGMNASKLLLPTDVLSLCHTLISQNARFLQEVPRKTKHRANKKSDAIVQLKRKARSMEDHYASNAFRFVVFGLDLFNTAYRRGHFDLKNPSIIARLEPMVAVIGNTLYSDNGLVLTQGLKASTSIAKCPLKASEKAAPVFVRQILDVVKQSGSTESEVAQAGLKALASILRDCSGAQVKEQDLVLILELIGPDIEEPARQPSVFAMLRAIVSRKFVAPEIYDLMDKVSEIMVTNQSSQVQELCRGVLLQFLLDYPQGKGRLRNQMTFLVKNLSYTYENGRKSVMELLNALISKFDPTLVKEYSDLIFVGLVMVLVNDDSSKCKEMAASLVKALLLRLDVEQRKTIISHLHLWCAQSEQIRLTAIAAQTYGLLIDALREGAEPYISTCLEDLASLLRVSAHDEYEDEEAMDVDLDWQVPYQALITQGKALSRFADGPSHAGAVDWSIVAGYLLYPHAWVRLAACRLLGQLFSAFPAAASGPASVTTPYPLTYDGARAVAGDLCSQLKSKNLDAALSLQIVKNLFYIGKCFAEMPWPMDKEEDPDDAEGTDEDGDDIQESPASTHSLPWLFSKLSYQARSAYIQRRNRAFSEDNWVHQPASVFRWFAAMVGHLPSEQVEKFLVHILSPVYRIAEDDTIRDDQIKELKTICIELQDLVQAKVGTTKFAEVYSQIRQGVTTVRRDRHAARAIHVTSHPQAAAKRKMERNQSKKVARKRRDAIFAHGSKSGKRKFGV